MVFSGAFYIGARHHIYIISNPHGNSEIRIVKTPWLREWDTYHTCSINMWQKLDPVLP